MLILIGVAKMFNKRHEKLGRRWQQRIKIRRRSTICGRVVQLLVARFKQHSDEPCTISNDDAGVRIKIDKQTNEARRSWPHNRASNPLETGIEYQLADPERLEAHLEGF